MIEFVRVIPDGGTRKPLDYKVPFKFRAQIQPGSRVRVPLRARLVLGTVVEGLEKSEVTGLREVEAVIGDRPEIPANLLRLADWVAKYYCCPREVAYRCVLPQVVRSAEAKPRLRKVLQIKGNLPSEIFEKLERRAPKQAALLQFLHTWVKPISSKEALSRSGSSTQALAALVKNGWVEARTEEWDRDPHEGEEFLPSKELSLNEEQQGALEKIIAACEESGRKNQNGHEEVSPRPILLYGVTGSGKTEVYLRAIRHVMEKHQTALVLVPEISLTPQTIERFKSRFSHMQKELAVLHSKLSDGERFDEWRKIRSGRAKIVIGARSAVFAPLENLGIIVVDEEHESSYKQEDAPRYHARDLAVVRGHFEHCLVLLGTATPSLETTRNVRIGKYRQVRLTKRVDSRSMPLIKILDMRQLNKGKGDHGIISPPLSTAIHARLERGQQVILFLNRRGYASSMVCPSCGYVGRCDHCSVAMTYHRMDGRLVCHICGYTIQAPQKCPSCGDIRIRHAGVGTERVEEAVRRMFPKASIARMDADSMTRKHAFREVLDAFRARKIDILIGTQMIAKGLDFPNVTLVGIVNADLSLHLPDFRAGERTFQLLTQVAGRAGRGEMEGEVFVQTFTPMSPAIQFARHHDFEGFSEQELEFRQRFAYPPFTHMVLITVRSSNLDKASFSALTLSRRLREQLPSEATLGEPAPAPLERAHGFHRFHVSIRGNGIGAISAAVRKVMDHLVFPEDVFVAVDVDPYQLL